ncbi:MAG: deoxyribonuclease/rho motif-related [Frankiales bacterium]|nr:deoxyribonuclease/rho motif-related [Frankiales bacterium]MCW2723312.1 deoxyribonuclease/rho motif-related [Frankiales bacterium]
MTDEDVLELQVGQVAAGGSCVARAPDGRVVFVRHALPGERVRAVVTATTSSFLRADAVEVLEASPDRVEEPCVYARPGRCGGCDWQHVALPRQRLLKAELVEEQLRRLAGLTLPVTVEPVPGDTDGLGWRTRVQFGVRSDGTPGLHRHRSHDLEPVDACLIATPDVEAVEAERLRWIGAQSVEVMAEGAQRVVHVTSRRRGSAQLPEVDAGLVVDGRPLRVPHGVRHEVLGRSFEVAAGGFWQVHPGAAQVLARTVLEVLDAQTGERVVDLFAGVGLFAALLGDRVGPTGSVLAIEGDARACADAARNTADLPHVRVRTAAVDADLVARGVGRPSLVVLDPPRAGAGLAVSRALVELRPRRIAYVACDPASFARDLKVFLGAGWSMPVLRAFDLFPMTEHVELVALLESPRSEAI